MHLSKQEKFLVRAGEIHGDRYLYSDDYVSSRQKVNIFCKIHGPFLQIARDHLSGKGCPKCGLEASVASRRHTLDTFVKLARDVHGNRYSYDEVIYSVSSSKVSICCPDHGPFLQAPQKHLQGSTCPKCSLENRVNSQKYTLDTFVKLARIAHGDKYSYDEVIYKGSYTKVSYTKVSIYCSDHGPFLQVPRSHIHNKSGCPKCASMGYSKVSVRWIEEYSSTNGISNEVAHFLSTGEFKIPGTKYKVDGYHIGSNTVLEFLGDTWHGNPSIFRDEDFCHPHKKTITAKELYTQTMDRLKHIHSLGYNVVYIWEADYRADLPATVIKKEELWR